MLYSNMAKYTDERRKEGLLLKVKTDDFFPYASSQYQYWSGYYTSRPALKRYVRQSNVFLQQVRQIDAIYKSHISIDLLPMRRSIALTQHHDGVSGTSKQAVADDYTTRLDRAIRKTEEMLSEFLAPRNDTSDLQVCLNANVGKCNISTQNLVRACSIALFSIL